MPGAKDDVVPPVCQHNAPAEVPAITVPPSHAFRST